MVDLTTERKQSNISRALSIFPHIIKCSKILTEIETLLFQPEKLITTDPIIIIEFAQLMNTHSLTQSNSNHNLVNVESMTCKPDFFILMKNTIFPIQKLNLKECGFFSKMDLIKKKVFVIQESLNITAFEFVLKSLCGKKQQFPKNNFVLQILEVSKFLEYKRIEKELAFDIMNNFDDYDFFVAFRIAEKLKVNWLEKRCLKEILTYDFEMININKTDLLEYDEKSFVSVLRKHYNLKKEHIISGITNANIKTVIQEYFAIHEVLIKEQDYCQIDQHFVQKMKDIKEQMEHQSNDNDECDDIRVRSNTWDPSISLDNEERKSFASTSLSLSSANLKEEILKLTHINEKIKIESLNYIHELKEFNQQIKSSANLIRSENLSDDKENNFDQHQIIKKKNPNKALSIFKELSMK